MKPLVSILIPAFNAEKWIADTIRSALGQTWPRTEVIVVDDGSHDRTLEIAKSFPGILAITQENQGAAAARNHAFRLCQGEFIQWLDADDLLAPDKIQKQMEFALRLADRTALLSSAWGRFRYRVRKAAFTRSLLWEDLPPTEWLLRKLELNLFMQTGAWLVSRELSEAAGEWDVRLMGDDDGEYFCRVIMASGGVWFVPEARIYYRDSGTSGLSYLGRSEKKLRAHWLSMQLHVGYVLSLVTSERSRRACRTYLQRQFGSFYPECPEIVQEMQGLAENLGGRLCVPGYSWKYSWIHKAFGWAAAKGVQLRYNWWKSSVLQEWDKALWRLEEKGAGGRPMGTSALRNRCEEPAVAEADCKRIPAESKAVRSVTDSGSHHA